jgi:hypothetical protein
MKRTRWAGNVTCMEANKNAYRVFVGKPEGNDHVEDLGVKGRPDIKLILK